MLVKPHALMDSYVKNPELVMLLAVFSGNNLREFFEEIWQMLNSKKIVEIQAFDLKSLLCGSKRNKKIKLNTNSSCIFTIATISYQVNQSYQSNLKKFFGRNLYIF